jgi:subtilisin-like proprotein convertase family protein
MKRIFTIITFCFLGLQLNAQLVPNYCFSQSTNTYTALSAPTNLFTGAWDDGVSAAVPIPFTFTFNGVGQTSCRVNTNGYITFGATLPATSLYTPISSTTAYSGAISAVGRDLQGVAASTISHQTLGVTPNRIFVVQWSNAKKYGFAGTGDNFNFQIRLYETSNIAEVMYGSVVSSATNAAPQVGLRGANNASFNNRSSGANWNTTVAGGTNAVTVNLQSANVPASGLTFTWTPGNLAAPTAVTATPATVSCGGSSNLNATSAGNTIRWYTVATGGVSIGSSASGANFSVSPGGTTTYYAEAFNAGTSVISCSRTAVTVTVTGVAPGVPTALTATPNPVCPGATANLTATSAGNTIRWYDAAVGGTLLGTSASGANFAVVPLSTTTYFAESFNGTCPSATRASIVVNTIAPPSLTATASPTSLCSPTPSVLTASSGAAPVYCTPASSCIFPDQISNVSFGGINRSSGCDGGGAGYTLFATPSASAVAGSTIPYSITTSGDVEGAAMWIDYNQDGTFAPSEQIFNGFAGTNPATYSGSTTIPLTAINGTTRMRVRCTYNANPNGLANPPCTNVTYGETEDYNITITGGVSPITYVWNPGSLSGASVSVTPGSTTTYTVTATATATGCTNSATATVTVLGTAPVVTCPSNQIANANASCQAVVNYVATTSVGTFSYSFSGVTIGTGSGTGSGSTFNIGVTNVTLTATSGSCSSTCSFTVTVNDVTGPVVTVPANISVSNAVGTCSATVSYTAPTATDNCFPTTLNFNYSGAPLALNDFVTANSTISASGLMPNLGSTVSLNSVCINLTHTWDSDLNIDLISPLGTVYNLSNGNGGSGDNYTNTCFNMSAGTPITLGTAPFTGTFIPQGAGGFANFDGQNPNGNWTLSIFDGATGDVGSLINWSLNFTNTGPPSISQTAGLASGATYPVGTTTNTFIATDAAGNTSSQSFTVTVNDTETPTITCPANFTVNNILNQCNALVNYTAPIGTDNCAGATTTQIGGLPSGSLIAVGTTTTNTFRVTDGAGNSAICSFTTTVIDAELPSITCPANQSFANALGTCGRTTTYALPTFSDNCPGVTIVQNPGDPFTSGDFFPVGVNTITYIATDASSNTNTCSFTITIVDNQAPTILCPSNVTIACTDNSSPAALGFATATDNCTPAVAININSSDATVVGTCLGNYTINRTWTATDAVGNSTTCLQTINVQDITGPNLIGVPADITVDCGSVPAAGAVAALDACSPVGSVPVTMNEVTTAGSCAGNYIITRTWTATDGCGNSSSQSQTITVTDVTAPVLAGVPSDLSIDCGDPIPVVGSPTASDDCSGATISFNEVTAAGSCAGNYTITRTWTATDVCGNSTSASQVITVIDVTGPLLSGVPANTTVNCTSLPVPATVTVSDNCSGVTILGVVFNETITPGSCAGNYVITRTWSATDNCNNTSSSTQTITVIDDIAPVIDPLPAVSTIDCSIAPSFATATATDNCSGVTITTADVTTAGACAGSYSITRTFTATDGCGNSSTATQTINVQDLTAPVITGLPATSTISCPATPVFTTPTATDNCSGAVLTFSNVTTPGTCAGNYSITRTWTATDGCGNSSTASQTINVQDLTAPVITGLPATSTISCPATPVFTTPTATDNCSGAVLTFSNVTTPGTCASNYSITRTWTATDGCGNSSTASQTINVQDLTGPTITCNAPVVINAGATCTAIVTLALPVVIDGCGAVTSIVNNHPSTTYTAGVTTVIWTATDACGNTSTCAQTVTVTSPEMDVTGNNISIADGSTTYSLTNYTDFGSTPICNVQVNKTYVIKNTGAGNLNLTGSPRVTISGVNAADYTVVTQPGLSVLAPGQSVSFVVRFDPTTTGFKYATININNNDCNENPYNYNVRGTARACISPNEEEEGTEVLTESGEMQEEVGTADVTTEPGIEFTLYPNPSNGIFNLSLIDMPREKTEIRLMDNLGQVIFVGELKDMTQSYDFSYLRAAVYYLQIVNEKSSITKQIIITHNY